MNHNTFIAALTDRALPVPPGLTSWRSPRLERRFSVYRNNVASALIAAIAARYPVVARLVGRDFFHAMTREYVLHHLPRSPVLIEYGRDYPDFLAAFPPASCLPYLTDVARLELARWEAYHAADAKPVGRDAFAAVAAKRLPKIRLQFLPSVAVLVSRFPIVSIWHTNTHDAEVKPVDLSLGEDALVARPELDVEIHRLPPGAATFLTLLVAEGPLGEAAAGALEAAADFDLALNLKALIEARIVARIL